MTDMLNQTGKFIVLGETAMHVAAMGKQDFAASGRTSGGKKAPVTGQTSTTARQRNDNARSG